MLRRLLSMFSGSRTHRRRRSRAGGGLLSRLLAAVRAFVGGRRRTRTRTRV